MFASKQSIARPFRSPGRGDRNGASPVPLGGTSDGREAPSPLSQPLVGEGVPVMG